MLLSEIEPNPRVYHDTWTMQELQECPETAAPLLLIQHRRTRWRGSFALAQILLARVWPVDAQALWWQLHLPKKVGQPGSPVFTLSYCPSEFDAQPGMLRSADHKRMRSRQHGQVYLLLLIALFGTCLSLELDVQQGLASLNQPDQPSSNDGSKPVYGVAVPAAASDLEQLQELERLQARIDSLSAADALDHLNTIAQNLPAGTSIVRFSGSDTEWTMEVQGDQVILAIQKLRSAYPQATLELQALQPLRRAQDGAFTAQLGLHPRQDTQPQGLEQ